MLTESQLVAYFQRAVAERWGYVWSLNGELYTRDLAEKYHRNRRSTSSSRDPATYWLEDCARWIGKMAADCSGGIVGAIRTVDPKYSDRKANTFYSQCTEKGKISTLPEEPGLCLWRSGHIGVYEGNGYALEFRGTEYGAVRTKVSSRPWTNWGRLRDIQYGDTDTVIDAPNEDNKVISLASPYMRGEDIAMLQAALNGLGYDCGKADGIAGANTMRGIRAFVAAHEGV